MRQYSGYRKYWNTFTNYCNYPRIRKRNSFYLAMSQTFAGMDICCIVAWIFFVVLLFYVYSKHLWSCWDGQLT